MTAAQPLLLEQHGAYKVEPFKSVAVEAWAQFLELAEPSNDLMHWMIDGFSSTVRITGRQIDLNEYSPDWTTTRPIVVIIDGFLESMGPSETVPSTTMIEEFREWVERGIEQAFTMKRIERRFVDLGFNKASFAIVSSATDSGLAEDELKMIWTNDKMITPTSIRNRQLASQKGKRHAIRKKKA